MLFINNTSFSYLLFPKNTHDKDCEGVFENDVDRLYYYLNRGVPMGDMPKPIYCTQEMVDQYGIENLVLSMQRNLNKRII